MYVSRDNNGPFEPQSTFITFQEMEVDLSEILRRFIIVLMGYLVSFKLTNLVGVWSKWHAWRQQIWQYHHQHALAPSIQF